VSAIRRASGRLRAPLERRYRSRAERWNIPDEETLDTTVLALARICVSEGGWTNDRDCAAIYQVLRGNRSNEESLIGAMRRHSRFVLEVWEPRSARHRWLVGLNLEATEPTGFPETASWDRYRPVWERRTQFTRGLVTGSVRMRPCPVPVVAWGGTMDDHIALRRGLVRVDCGDTENRFWGRPNRVPMQHRADRGATDDGAHGVLTGKS
jgi:hypothetical protein